MLFVIHFFWNSHFIFILNYFIYLIFLFKSLCVLKQTNRVVNQYIISYSLSLSKPCPNYVKTGYEFNWISKQDLSWVLIYNLNKVFVSIEELW